MTKKTKRWIKIGAYFLLLIIIYNAPLIKRALETFEKSDALSSGIIFLLIGLIITIILLQTLLNIFDMRNLKIEQKIKGVSKRYAKLLEINGKYKFNDISNINRTIYENEYSHKAFDRAVADDIILYNIENNRDNLRTDILNAYRNKKIYDNYLKEIGGVDENTPEEDIKALNIAKNKFIKVEKKIWHREMISKNVYDIKVHVNIQYVTPRKKYSYKKDRVVEYQELCDIYMKWHNGKKFANTVKRERSYMSDSLRYDVLKRDNYKCKICGASSKDGAKLHVDHIIPVSKGGKTTMSNLQTLCERCNKGKSNK